MQTAVKLIYCAIMKLWFKYLIGIAIGIAAALLLPQNNIHVQTTVEFISNLMLRFGRYMLLPVLFFSVATACFKLNEEKMILKTGFWTFVVIFASTLLLVLIGLISARLVPLPRIPSTFEKSTELPSLNIKFLLESLFPYSGFEALTNGAYLLPCFVFAGLAGAGASSEKSASKTAFSIFDALSKVCYNVMAFITEILAVGMIAIAAKWMFSFSSVMETGVYKPLFILLTVDIAVTAFVIYPFLLKLLCKENHPYRVLYANFCPFLTAFFSGDTNLALTLELRHGKESLGIRRRTNAVALPLFSIFGRGGTAMVQAVSFIVILHSFSPLKIELSNLIWIATFSFLISLCLCSYPSGGSFVAITIMCTLYGRSFDSGYLLLKSAAPLLCAYAAGMDAITAMFGSYFVAHKTHSIEKVELRHFI